MAGGDKTKRQMSEILPEIESKKPFIKEVT